MARYMVLYNSDLTARELMKNASPDEMQASMAKWTEWQRQASNTIKVEFGLPLQPVSQVTPNEITTSASHVSGYSMIEGDSKEAILEQLKSHPHLKSAGATVDLFELLAMPGL